MKLKLLLLNAQDLFVFMDKYKDENLNELSEPKWQLLSTSFYPNKSLKDLLAIASMVKTNSPDIFMMTEVGGFESASNFNKYFLNDEYNVIVEPSNSDRGIDLGHFIRKSLPYKIYYRSYTKEKLCNKKYFSRGVFELQLRDKNDEPKFINFLVHLKSKLNKNGDDFEGRKQREAEIKLLTKLYKKRSEQYPNTPCLVAGDLNGVIYNQDTEPEFNHLINAGLKDVLEITDKPFEKRVTYCYFDKGHNRFDMQLDYILLSAKFKDKIYSDECGVFDIETDYVAELPSNLVAKRKLPSDHYPLRCAIDI